MIVLPKSFREGNVHEVSPTCQPEKDLNKEESNRHANVEKKKL